MEKSKQRVTTWTHVAQNTRDVLEQLEYIDELEEWLTSGRSDILVSLGGTKMYAEYPARISHVGEPNNRTRADLKLYANVYAVRDEVRVECGFLIRNRLQKDSAPRLEPLVATDDAQASVEWRKSKTDVWKAYTKEQSARIHGWICSRAHRHDVLMEANGDYIVFHTSIRSDNVVASVYRTNQSARRFIEVRVRDMPPKKRACKEPAAPPSPGLVPRMSPVISRLK